MLLKVLEVIYRSSLFEHDIVPAAKRYQEPDLLTIQCLNLVLFGSFNASHMHIVFLTMSNVITHKVFFFPCRFFLFLITAINYVAISEALRVSPSVLAAGVAVDNVICAIYFMVLFALASKIPPEASSANGMYHLALI